MIAAPHHHFVSPIVEDPRERDYLKTILHRVYGTREEGGGGGGVSKV